MGRRCALHVHRAGVLGQPKSPRTRRRAKGIRGIRRNDHQSRSTFPGRLARCRDSGPANWENRIGETMTAPAKKEELGIIYTFYSFKGGVGRTMALANVAALLAKWGHSVLVA